MFGVPHLIRTVAAASLLAGCGLSTQAAAGHGRAIDVVAAENFWGSLAAQVGGDHVHVSSIVTDPNADPHSYEPTAADARSVAEAGMVVDNGVGYDPWASKLVASDPGRRTVLDVGRLLKLTGGANPHRWYDPADVHAAIGAMAGDYARLDPADAGYFQARAVSFDHIALGPYHAAMARIVRTYGGTPVGASESIFSLLAPALGLHVVTPSSFLKAISEGTEPSAADKATIDHQIAAHRIRIYVYNRQNTTPDVAAQVAECRAAGIPTATITETLAPANTTYQAWQTRQLQGILDALHAAASQ